MFTGIIEEIGKIIELSQDGGNMVMRIQSEVSSQLKIDQSLSHDGVCLTVVNLGPGWHEVVAIAETLARSSFQNKQVGDIVNLERAMNLHRLLDGHLVQGHVDTTAEVIQMKDQDGSHLFAFKCEHPDFEKLTVDKGSITVNGVSLTLIQPDENSFQVAIIPYTHQHTNFSTLQLGDAVNVEFDIIGKYIAKQIAPYQM